MITIEDIKQAANMIRDNIVRTPLIYSNTISRMFDSEVYLKLENLQRTGSFKIRGASYKLRKLRRSIGISGVVAASAGNHAQGVSLAAQHLNMQATIIMPEWVSISKQEATARYGGRVVIFGQSLQDCLDKAQEFVQQGNTLIHPYDDPDIITGQGTIGIEILEDLPDADLILVPVGGGGLISGIASASMAIKPEIRIIGVQAEVCPSAREALTREKPFSIDAKPSIADGINVSRTGDVPFQIIQKQIENIVTVDEEHIAAAVLMLLERKKVLAEGAGAVCLAALMSKTVTVTPGSRVVLVISGGNVDSPLLGRIINKGLIKRGRIMNFQVLLNDRPGSLAKMLGEVAKLKANVLRIDHNRNVRDLPVDVACVDLDIETRGPAHVADIRDRLKQAGYEITP